MAPTLFRADQIGSLLRPQYLLDANLAIAPWGQMHTKFNEDAAPELIEAVHEAERRAVKDVVAQQVEKGVSPITSGEFERASFVSGFFEKLDGMEVQFRTWEDFRTEVGDAKLLLNDTSDIWVLLKLDVWISVSDSKTRKCSAP